MMSQNACCVGCGALGSESPVPRLQLSMESSLRERCASADGVQSTALEGGLLRIPEGSFLRASTQSESPRIRIMPMQRLGDRL